MAISYKVWVPKTLPPPGTFTRNLCQALHLPVFFPEPALF